MPKNVAFEKSPQKEKNETTKSELEDQIKKLEEKLSEAELMSQKAQNQLEQVQAQFNKSYLNFLNLKDEKKLNNEWKEIYQIEHYKGKYAHFTLKSAHCKYLYL